MEKYQKVESVLDLIAESKSGINFDLTSKLKKDFLHQAKQLLIVEEMQRRIYEKENGSYNLLAVDGLSYQPIYGAIFARYRILIEKDSTKQPKPKSVDKFQAQTYLNLSN